MPPCTETWHDAWRLFGRAVELGAPNQIVQGKFPALLHACCAGGASISKRKPFPQTKATAQNSRAGGRLSTDQTNYDMTMAWCRRLRL